MSQEKQTTLGVIGLGYVGLPLCVEAGKEGIRVIGFDVKQSVADGVNAGRSHIQDVPADELAELVEAGTIEATTDMSRLGECDVVSICVPTPLSKTRDPDVSYILAASQSVAGGLRKGQLVILESTTYPGTTREVLLPALEETGLKVGVDFNLCFSPERVDPGNATWNTKNTPKVVGGITAECTAAGERFYERFLDTVVAVSSAEAAEMTKILENTFRAVNIGSGQRDRDHRRTARGRRVGGDRRGRDQTLRLHAVHAGPRVWVATAFRSTRTTSPGRCGR